MPVPTRSAPEQQYLILLNFSGQDAALPWPVAGTPLDAELLLGNLGADAEVALDLKLRPWEARVYRLPGS